MLIIRCLRPDKVNLGFERQLHESRPFSLQSAEHAIAVGAHRGGGGAWGKQPHLLLIQPFFKKFVYLLKTTVN